MKKLIHILLALCISTAAFAETATKAPSSERVTLTLDQGGLLAKALTKLNGSPAPGAPDTLIPFSFSGDFTRTALFRDSIALSQALQEATAATQKTLAAVNLRYHLVWLPAQANGQASIDLAKTRPEDAAAGVREISAALSMPFDVDLYKISEADLNLSGNPLPPTIGVELAPILKLDPQPAAPAKK